MKISKLKYCVFLICCLSLSVYGQDIHFSQFESAPLNLNPANCGLFEGKWRISANHRNQWQSVTVPYKTYSLSIDTKIAHLFKKLKLSAGILLNNDKAGDADLGMTEADIPISLQYELSGNKDISVGILPSYSWRSFDYQELKFGNQYDGEKYDPSISSGFIYDDEISFFDISAGLVFSHDPISTASYSCGFSINHINKPCYSFYDDDNVSLQPRYSLFGSGIIRLSPVIDALPAFLFMKQSTYIEFDIGSRFAFSTENKKVTAIYGGLFYRLSDALIISTGFDYMNMNVGISYDINTSDLTSVSHGRGGIEIAITYRIKNTVPIKIPEMFCPVYL